MTTISKWLAMAVGAQGVLLVAGCVGQELKPESPEPPAAAEATPAAAAPVAAATPGVPASPPKACAGETVAAAEGLLDDLEDGNGQLVQQAGRGGYWYAAADNKGSTVSGAGAFSASEGGAAGTKKSAHAVGKTVTGDGAWGAVFGFGILPENQAYDLSRFAGVSFWAKVGEKSTASVRFKVADVNTRPEGKVCKEPGGCWNHFGIDLTLTKEWKEYTVKFSDLRQQDGWGDPRPATLTASQAMTLDWSISGGQEFDIWVDEVKLIDCK